jgi:hypothetical protein
MADELSNLASDVDDALVSVDELKETPGAIDEEAIAKAKRALEQAKGVVDEMEDVED